MIDRYRPPPWRWFHGAALYATVQGLTWGLYALVSALRGRRTVPPGQIKEFYEAEYRPVFSPPAWAFGPAWTINNISAIWGLLRALNAPRSKDRDAFVALQGASWVDFVLFSAASFGLRSNINSLVLTKLYLGLTLASLYVALFRLRDRPLGLSLGTLTTWLLVATGVSAGTAAWNRDDFYGLGPFVTPDPRLAKRGA